MLLALCILALGTAFAASPTKVKRDDPHGLIVNTSSGVVHGILNDTYPGVRRFLSIPYAAPPVGNLRWKPPQPYTSKGDIRADRYGPACPQFNGNSTTGFYNIVPGFNVAPELLGEDCLTVSVYAPVQEDKERGLDTPRLPVFIWIYGGGFTAGGANTPYEYPDRWIQRSKGLIFVEMNFRVNIFGFPGAAGLSSQNLGQLDQRFAMEWVRDNIAAFGGDPNRMVLIGQSAGGTSTDLQIYTNLDDPIVKGSISHSGNAHAANPRQLTDHSNFTFVASHVGCGGLSAAKELACMRKVSWQKIEGFLKNWSDSGSQPPFGWGPVIDEVVIFSNYTDRARRGLVQDIPTIMGHCLQDGIAFYTPFSTQSGPLNYFAYEIYQDTVWVCPGSYETMDYIAGNHTIFRFLYAGDFKNISPLPWAGAFHASDIPILFGSHQDWPWGPPSKPREYAVSHAMQDLWLAFAANGSKGLVHNGWHPVSATGGDLLLIGMNDSTLTYTPWLEAESFCF